MKIVKIHNGSGDEVDENGLNKRIGETIKSIRLTTPWSKDVHQKPMTQTKLSEKCNVTFQQIQKFENGKNKISFDKVIMFCQQTGTGYDYFLNTLNGRTLITNIGG